MRRLRLSNTEQKAMSTPEQQTDRDLYRLIIFNRDRSSVLVSGEKDKFALPSAEIPRWQRIAENLTTAIRSKYGCVALALFEPERPVPASDFRGQHHYVLECQCNHETHADNTLWRSAGSLTRDCFQSEIDHEAFQSGVTQSDAYEKNAKAPFGHRGWFSELSSWVTESIQSFGLNLTGRFRQFNASPSFSLIRFESDGPAFWFKAVGEPNEREFPITLKLAELFPQYLPTIIAVRPAWNGWLSLEAPGINLSETDDVAHWVAAAEILARLQLDSIGKIDSIAKARAHDARVESLGVLIDPFLDVMTDLMQRQTKIPPPILTQSELSLLGLGIREALGAIADLAIPDALGHMDLNPGNVFPSRRRTVFLDWAEAYVGHPLYSLEYLLEHLQRSSYGNAQLESQLVGAYCNPWQQISPVSVVRRARRFSPLLAAFVHATATDAWRNKKKLEDPGVAGYLRSLARRMHKEAAQFVRQSTRLSV